MTVVVDTGAPLRGVQLRVFSRVVVGVDGSEESLDAAAQSARLLDPAGELTLFGVYHVEPTLVGGLGGGAPEYLDEDRHRASAAAVLDAARQGLPAGIVVERRTARGWAWHELLREAEAEQATLVAVGSHGRGRMIGLVLGSTATAIVHRAPCSVLVARAARSTFPQAVVVGVDGSEQSLAAAAVARHVAATHGATFTAVAATGGKPVDREPLVELGHRLATEASRSGDSEHALRWSDEPPLEALLRASTEADLLVVGSRGRHGLAALGSVGQRLAHQAGCSVLILREQPLDATALAASARDT